jgi:hypothetical protein
MKDILDVFCQKEKELVEKAREKDQKRRMEELRTEFLSLPDVLL